MVTNCPFYSGGKCHKKIARYKSKPKDKIICRYADHWKCPRFLESAVSYVEEKRIEEEQLFSEKLKKNRKVYKVGNL